MNKKNHFFFELVILLVLWGFIEKITLTMIILPIFWGTLFSDFDFQIKSHRNILFHSIVPNFFIWVYNSTTENVIFIFSVSIHLLADLIPMIKKRGGFSCIDIFGLKRFNTKWSAVWLLLNINIGIILLILEVI